MEKEKRPFVYVAVPTSGTVRHEALAGLLHCARECDVHMQGAACGMHALNFNSLWADALNLRAKLGLTRWAMHHDDIEAPPWWLDVLNAEMDATGADVMSAVVTIKDDRYVTSTAVADPGPHNIRRLTLREIYDLPETFDAQAMGLPRGRRLLVNTGLWVCRFDADWVRPPVFPGFQIHNGLFTRPDGTVVPAQISEDWWFSDWAAAQGLRVFATRKLCPAHHGHKRYASDRPRGLEKDLGDEEYAGSMRARLAPGGKETEPAAAGADF